MDRRQFLKAGLALGATTGSFGLPTGFLGEAQAADLGFDLTNGVRRLDLYRPETGERLNIDFMTNGVWREDAYPRLCWLLRDFHANDWVQMDLRLLAILDWTQRYLRQYGYNQPLQILSAYRTRKTNKHTEGAAKDSQHMYGRAVDLRIPGLSAAYLGRLFQALSAGGVGIYDSKNFVHVDTGAAGRVWHR